MIRKYLSSIIILFIASLICFISMKFLFSSEFGDGSEPDFPTDIDTYRKMTSTHIITSDMINELQKGIINVEVELGTNTAGGYDTVRDRLDTFISSSTAQVTNYVIFETYIDTTTAPGGTVGTFRIGFDSTGDFYVAPNTYTWIKASDQ